MRRAGAVVLAVALVVLIPVPAGAATAYKEPVTPYADLPTQQKRVFASDYDDWVFNNYGQQGVNDLDTAWPAGSAGDLEQQSRAKAYLAEKGYPNPSAVSADRVATAAKDGTSTAKVAKPVTSAGRLARGVAGASVVADGFLAGFAIGDGLTALYVMSGEKNPLDAACGTDMQGVVEFAYVLSAPDCSLHYLESQINADVTAVPVGWSASPLQTGKGPVTTNAGEFLSWWAQLKDVTGPALGSTGTLSLRGDGGVTGNLSANSTGWSDGQASFPVGLQLLRPDGTWDGAVGGLVAPKVGGGVRFSGFTTQGNNSATYQVSSYYVPNWQYKGWRLVFGEGSKAVYWYPEGTPDRPKGRSADPQRQAGCTIEWPDGTSTEVAGQDFLESVGFPIYSAGQACNEAARTHPGEVPKSVAVTSKNKESGETTPLTKQTAPEYTPEERASLADKTGKGLQLFKSGVSCLTWEADCSGWWEATNRGAATGTDYSCTYGDAVVSLAQCTVYQRTFDDKTATANPVITDPVTGEAVEWSSKTDPANRYGTGAQSNQDKDRCVTSFTLNPVDWVLRPLRCAFEPRQSKVDEFARKFDRMWRGSTPGKFALSLAAVGVAFDSLGPGDCRGVILPVPKVQPGSFLPAIENRPVLQACPGDFFEPFAPVFFWLISVSICVGGFFIVKAQLDRLVNNS